MAHLGMTRRELEAEVRWVVRRIPDKPEELVKLLTDLMVRLIEKNNTAIADALSATDPDDDGRGI